MPEEPKKDKTERICSRCGCKFWTYSVYDRTWCLDCDLEMIDEESRCDAFPEEAPCDEHS